jgi:hypothetical protein
MVIGFKGLWHRTVARSLTVALVRACSYALMRPPSRRKTWPVTKSLSALAR